MLDAINILKNFGILNCIVGVGALKYYGASRVLHVFGFHANQLP